MFHFVGRSMPMLPYLKQYIANWHWCHATDVVPMVAAIPAQAWPLWTEETLRDEWLRPYLIRSLIHWRAFRNSNTTVVPDPYGAFRRHLARFIADLQAIPETRLHLSNVSEADIGVLASRVTSHLIRFGLDVKGRDSCVLPSKAAHFLLLGLIPAFDGQVIRDRVLWNLLPDACDMESYILLCWWVLQRFEREGTLQAARDLVAEYMLSQPMEWTRRFGDLNRIFACGQGNLGVNAVGKRSPRRGRIEVRCRRRELAFSPPDHRMRGVGQKREAFAQQDVSALDICSREGGHGVDSVICGG